MPQVQEGERMSESAISLRSLLVDFLKNNPYMFDMGGEITDPSTQYPSQMRPDVVVKTTQCQFVENITWAVENDDETDLPRTFTEMLEALDEDISFGSYICEDGSNQIVCWPDYFDTEAEALAWFDEWKQSDHGKNETRRLAFLRAIREEVSA
tara:strand:+ start:229 stop:687 length:459 start_codon:yes stop_codon:yes gene_type:complete